ncbi:hypothetical protein BDN70DRAFT_887954, partial [Pholiota conissans]
TNDGHHGHIERVDHQKIDTPKHPLVDAPKRGSKRNKGRWICGMGLGGYSDEHADG